MTSTIFFSRRTSTRGQNPSSSVRLTFLTSAALVSVMALHATIATPADHRTSGTHHAQLHTNTTPTLKLVGQASGTSWAVAAEGHYAFLPVGPRLLVLDLEQPVSPRVVGASEVFTQTVRDVAVANGFAYLAILGAGVAVLDVRRPEAPRTVVHLWPRYGAVTIHVDGGRLYVKTGHTLTDGSVEGDIYVFDISNPLQPAAVGDVHLARNAYFLTVANGLAVALVNSDHIELVDLRDPARGKIVASLPSIGGDAATIADQYVFMASQRDGLIVIDIHDPTSPQIVATVALEFEPVSIAKDGANMYLAGKDEGLAVVDVRKPAVPTITSQDHVALTSVDAAIAGKYLIVAANDRNLESATRWGELTGGLEVFSLQQPGPPQAFSTFAASSIEAYEIAVSGSHAFVSEQTSHSLPSRPGKLRAFHVGETANLLDEAIVSAPEEDRYGALASAGHYVFATTKSALAIFDVQNWRAPRQVGTITTAGDGTDFPQEQMAVRGNLLAVTEGLQYIISIFNIANPAQPMRIRQIVPYALHDEFVAHAFDVALDETNLYVTGTWGKWDSTIAQGGSGLLIVAADDAHEPPASALLVLDGAPETYGVAVQSGNAYIALGKAGLAVVDVTNAMLPREVGRITKTVEADAVAVMGDYAFVADSAATMAMIDVSDPAHPRQVAQSQPADWIGLSGYVNRLSIAAADGFVYLTHSDMGVFQWRVDGVAWPTATATAQDVPTATVQDAPTATAPPVTPTAEPTTTPVPTNRPQSGVAVWLPALVR